MFWHVWDIVDKIKCFLNVISCQLFLVSALEEGLETQADEGVPEYIFLHDIRQRSFRRKGIISISFLRVSTFA